MTRTEALKNMETRYPYANLFKKLKAACRAEMQENLNKLDNLGHLEFEYAVNRLYLNKDNKPKNWKIICDLLVTANAMVHVKGK